MANRPSAALALRPARDGVAWATLERGAGAILIDMPAGRVEGENRMAELILVFCLATAPADCQEERPALADMSLTSCLVQGQQYAADWLADHPKWTLAGWRCLQNVPRQRES